VRTRILSSIGVVIAGLLPTISGGPVFLLLLLVLCGIGFREFLRLGNRASGIAVGPAADLGILGIAALGIAAFWQADSLSLFSALVLSSMVPLAVAVGSASVPGAFIGWALTSSGALYLGLPVFSAVALRGIPGQIDASWLSNLATTFAFGWDSAPRGLAWVLAVVLATWVGDSLAYLAGRRLGRHKLAPGISPNKTVEGALAGLLGAAVTCVLWFAASGLGPLWVGAAVGVIAGLSGQLGDLAESMLKRQAGVKDSGSIIPGHGGILDRIDALLFAFPAVYLAAMLVERIAA
jgi:phosphatidate cytidylyltransferase